MHRLSEKRSKPRIICDYPVIIEGYDSAGNKYNENARLANLSASGLYMLADRNFEIGSILSVTILLSGALIENDTPRIVTIGIIVRTELQVDGTYGVAIKFTNYRFL